MTSSKYIFDVAHDFNHEINSILLLKNMWKWIRMKTQHTKSHGKHQELCCEGNL